MKSCGHYQFHLALTNQHCKQQGPLLEAVAGLPDELGDQLGCHIAPPLSVRNHQPEVNHKVSS